MPILEDLRAAGIAPDNRTATLAYIGALPIPRDRREGLWRLYCTATSTQPSLAEIETVRVRANP